MVCRMSRCFLEGAYQSGEEIIKSNSWDEEGSHVITVRVKDIYGYEGESATLEVLMLKNKVIKPFLKFLDKDSLMFSILSFMLNLK